MDLLAKILKLFISPRRILSVGNPKKILVFKPGAIGDILWTTPFLKILRKQHPKAELVYCVGRWSKDVLENNPNLNRLIIVDDSKLMKKNIVYTLKLIRELRKEKFDAVFTFEKHYLSSMLIWATGIPIKIGFDRFGEGFPLNITASYANEKHEIEYDLDLLSVSKNDNVQTSKKGYEKVFGKDYWKTQVFPTKHEIRKVEELFKKNKIKGRLVGIAPGGGKNTGQETMFRRWPVQRYIELTNMLLKKKYKMILFGGPSDIDLVKNFDKNCIDLIGMLNPRESIHAMGKCDYFVCNDSGPMNMAAASNSKKLKIISLFGPTRPDRKAPLNPGSKSIWKDSDIYYPEYDLYGQVKNTEKFMDRIRVDDVLKMIK